MTCHQDCGLVSVQFRFAAWLVPWHSNDHTCPEYLIQSFFFFFPFNFCCLATTQSYSCNLLYYSQCRTEIPLDYNMGPSNTLFTILDKSVPRFNRYCNDHRHYSTGSLIPASPTPPSEGVLFSFPINLDNNISAWWRCKNMHIWPKKFAYVLKVYWWCVPIIRSTRIKPQNEENNSQYYLILLFSTPFKKMFF